ncbi:MAG: PAS domain S-box protein [Proteobacteria bacterium]|nr:PAS domain S-box protein [Pseudomonadota bacterium]MBU1452354.1 PAS domain S-box protein [Pseudomonadota bacterium]MBU2468905.1 PAS domain S-box protein [Pseudomonadota bacterium]MBU2519482.1 PAS domain S-box protein [Pseudomonadota bacterium]
MNEQLTSTFNTQAVISYVRRRRPEAVPLLLQGLEQTLGLTMEETEALLCHPGRWVPQEVYCEMLRRAREDILEDPRAPYRLFFEALTFHNWGPLKTLFLRLMGSPRSVIRAAPWLIRRFTRSVERVWASELTDSSCLLHLVWKPQAALSHDNCLAIMGALASLPLRWGSPPATVVEEACFFEGHPATVLRLSWTPHTWRLRLRGAFRGVNAGRARFLVDSLNEHARQVELLTEQSREMSRALAQEQRRFQALAENISLGMAFLDSRGRFLYSNPALSQMFGYSRQQLTDLDTWRGLAYPDPQTRRRVEQAWREDSAAGEGAISQRTFRVRCADGQDKDVLLRAGFLAEGERFLLMEDVTMRLAAQERLGRSEALMRAVLEGSPDAVLVLDQEGRVLMANRAAQEVLSFREPMAGKPWLELLPPERRSWGQSLWEWVRQGKVAREELELPLAGQEGQGVFEIMVVSLEGGVVIINLRDITHRDRLEKERQKAARLAGVVELAGTAAHELNQPLTSLLACSEMMGLYQEVPDLQRQAVRIRQDTLRLAGLVERFGRIVRYETKEYLPGRRIIDLDKAAAPKEEPPDHY